MRQRTDRTRSEPYPAVSICPDKSFRDRHRDSIYRTEKEKLMNSLVYIVGAIVIIAAVLSFFGLR
ncbi:MAG TPA: hypothetical protein VK572_15730 [Burkholderiales bacterium]|nr:hypothetical protein [Burkholderiales bacterium]